MPAPRAASSHWRGATNPRSRLAVAVRDTNDLAKLDPLAVVKLRSVMLFPEALLQREKYMALVASETGVGEPRRSAFSPDEAEEKDKRQSRHGAEAGAASHSSAPLLEREKYMAFISSETGEG